MSLVDFPWRRPVFGDPSVLRYPRGNLPDSGSNCKGVRAGIEPAMNPLHSWPACAIVLLASGGCGVTGRCPGFKGMDHLSI